MNFLKELLLLSSLYTFPLRKLCNHKIIKFTNFKYYWRAINWSLFNVNDKIELPKYITLLKYYACFQKLNRPILGYLYSKVIPKKNNRNYTFWFVDVELNERLMILSFTCYDYHPMQLRIRYIRGLDKHTSYFESKTSFRLMVRKKGEYFTRL